MICNVISAAELVYKQEPDALFIYGHLTNENSDFNRKLRAWLLRQRQPVDADGSIAIVIDQGEIIGWARTEYWLSDAGEAHNTLEAFVAREHRGRGVAAFASSGLYAIGDDQTVAVFSPRMLLVARRAGFWPVLYEKDGDGRWVAA